MRRKRVNKSKSKRKKVNEEKVETIGEYIVEKILDWGLHDNGVLMYLIKWENYDESENSWEFENHVKDCEELIEDFRVQTVNGKHPPKYSFEEFDELVKYLKDIINKSYKDFAVLRYLFVRNYSSSESQNIKVLDEMKFKISNQLNRLLEKKFKSKTNAERIEMRFLVEKVAKDLNIYKEFNSMTQFFEFVDQRKLLLKELNEWQHKQNSIIESGKEGLPISVVNDVDLEKPILNEYITDYILDVKIAKGLKIENEKPLVECNCVDCYSNRDECCTAVVGFPLVYNKNGSLRSSRFNTIVFECNTNCKCDQNCPNRVIQRGRQTPLQIFRTESKIRGWGVRALKSIPKGQFISRYTGEVISLNEAGLRPTTYLFDLSTHLDTKDVEFTYVVDAGNYGNITRFVNHSCEPNCRILFAWINNFDKLLPIIALFAIKPIKPYEELTYDYSMELIDIFNDDDSEDSLMTSDSDSDNENESNDFTEVTPFGAQQQLSLDHQKEFINGNDNDSMSVNNCENISHKTQRKITYNKISCECGAKTCRGFLYS